MTALDGTSKKLKTIIEILKDIKTILLLVVSIVAVVVGLFTPAGQEVVKNTTEFMGFKPRAEIRNTINNPDRAANKPQRPLRPRRL